MIRYPKLPANYSIGITAPSSGIEIQLHYILQEVKRKFESNHQLIIGDSTYTQDKAKSAPSEIRAKELNTFLQSEEIDIVIPPWGGELAIEILDKIDFEGIRNKWILGYSDISVILLPITLKTGIATAHGTNLVDLRGKYSDETTKKWENVLKTSPGESNTQYSSKQYQSKWDHNKTTDYVFNFDKKTEWKSLSGNNMRIEGRLLGGCIDVIRHLVGTPFGNVKGFREEYINNEPIIWYLENCELSPLDLRRSLVQMKFAGWFDDCKGILFGRTPISYDSQGYTVEDVYQDIADDLKIPVIYDIDCGHQPPQITFINGAFAIVEYFDGKGIVEQRFI
ncbi:S66 family peptidase [Globicatella sulfidifaciens]|uniref:Muramoyltetrapeptide carboxypeptidase LdcA (Peptidoglycan recycling) n=1 Tax=Globicatella sulfidifaciens DSM 15739 TaxID=1121925 RepID=A0A1T4L1G6_9LACT|nr:S66 peptidase family protein [Globicatella sulfidifaciens]SJZ48536.1 Muramoyltetrapeptide carboxypeptidase LdcA (peptidoglycan recycling) [Globicatella sulfidifaciens DSM 15739]